MYIWRSDGSFMVSVFSLYLLMSSRGQIQVASAVQETPLSIELFC